MNPDIAFISQSICIAGGLQGTLLILALNRKFKDKNVDRRWLIVFLAAVTITLLGRVLYLYPESIDPRFPILSDLILFVYGPLYYFFVRSVFRDTSVTKGAMRWWPHFIPVCVHLGVSIPLFFLDLNYFLKSMQTGSVFLYFNIIMSLALLHNLIYWYQGHQLVRSIQEPYNDLKVKLSASYVLYMRIWYLVVIVSFAAVVLIYPFNVLIAGIGYQIVWILASWLVFGLGYLVMTLPETYGDVLVEVKQSVNPTERARFENMGAQVLTALEEKRIFLDPEISLMSMAKLLNTNNVMLSKTINHFFEVGFYELINKYRVEEFIRLAGNPDNSHFTYYALALQAGFNSKTSFNKYFKKITGLTPKQYFRKLSVA